VVVASDGTVARRLTLPTPEFRTVTRDLDEIEVALLPRVAWRMVAHGSDVFVLHQRSVAHVPVFDVAGGSYSGPGGCTAGVVESVITRIRGAGSTVAASIAPALVTDLAVSADGSTLWLSSSTTRTTSTLHSLATNRVDAGPEVPCIEPVSYETADRESLIGTQRISIAILPDGTPVSQVRLPNAVEIGVTGARIAFGADGEADTGHALFHLTTPVGLACASCHPEAGEDGHTWTFGSPDVPLLRRTQSLRGGLVSTAPFHWAGEHADLTSIMREGFTRRMNGRDLSVDEVAALAHWLDAIPATTGLATDPATLERGRALFEGTSAGCTTCHSGEQLTDSRTLNVGTGGAFQVPTLRGVGSRAPFFHDGRASSVVATIDGTQARAHGGASSLAPSDLADLVAYVESL
jgi:cytochrome c553